MCPTKGVKCNGHTCYDPFTRNVRNRQPRDGKQITGLQRLGEGNLLMGREFILGVTEALWSQIPETATQHRGHTNSHLKTCPKKVMMFTSTQFLKTTTNVG